MTTESLNAWQLSTAGREDATLAPYAMHSADSAGRKYPEPAHPYRGPFQRDRDRIVHSAAFRRLSFKTQVHTGELGDYHRTRLTHTLEVASVSRTVSRALALNEDLTEALAMLHDLGHPPFGHAGEEVLHTCLAEQGGFCHNRQALRIVEELEVRYPEFPGLNLSWEVLEGQAARATKNAAPLRPLLESQVVEAADSITYDTHDADDALELRLLTLDELLDVPLWAQAARRVQLEYASLQPSELRRAVLHELIDWQVSDLLTQAAERIAELGVDSPQAVRRAATIVAVGPELAEQKRQLEAFLHERVYRHPEVVRLRLDAQARLRRMFDGLMEHPELLPDRYHQRSEVVGLARCVADYLAGMTDRFALQECERRFGG